MQEALERSEGRGSGVGYAPADAEGDCEPIESIVRVWLAPPDRGREEREGADGEGFGVRRGGLWWHYDPHNGALSNEHDREVGSGIGEEVWWLLDPLPSWVSSTSTSCCPLAWKSARRCASGRFRAL